MRASNQWGPTGIVNAVLRPLAAIRRDEQASPGPTAFFGMFHNRRRYLVRWGRGRFDKRGLVPERETRSALRWRIQVHVVPHSAEAFGTLCLARWRSRKP